MSERTRDRPPQWNFLLKLISAATTIVQPRKQVVMHPDLIIATTGEFEPRP
jgi:hypothetical protein